jgi:threonine/homoserine/homoserine lactone efflux protein
VEGIAYAVSSTGEEVVHFAMQRALSGDPLQSWPMKWIWVIVLVIIGAFFTYVAIEYFTSSLHALPSFFPGHVSGHKRGRSHKRGAVAAVIALLAYLGAAYLAYRVVRQGKAMAGGAGPATGAGSSADILSDPPAAG